MRTLHQDNLTVCKQCGFEENGELEDTCARCSCNLLPASEVSPASKPRQLRPQTSHPDAPEKKQSRQDILSGMRNVVQEELKPVKEEVAQLHSRMNQVDETAKFALQAAEEAKQAAKQFQSEAKEQLRRDTEEMKMKVQQLEAAFSKFTLSPSNKAGGSVAVVGGLKDVASSFAAAKAWLLDSLQKHSVEGVADIFHKAAKEEDWNGMVFVKFSSVEKRDAGILTFNAASSTATESKTKMGEDRPLQDRMKFNFLLKLKKLLAEMGSRVSFDADAFTMAFSGKDVLKVSTENLVLKTEWLDSEWADWKELHQSSKFIAIRDEVQARLNKGKGKGPSASSR